jgi:hypothetical protein
VEEMESLQDSTIVKVNNVDIEAGSQNTEISNSIGVSVYYFFKKFFIYLIFLGLLQVYPTSPLTVFVRRRMEFIFCDGITNGVENFNVSYFTSIWESICEIFKFRRNINHLPLSIEDEKTNSLNQDLRYRSISLY